MVKYYMRFYPTNFIPERLNVLELKFSFLQPWLSIVLRFYLKSFIPERLSAIELKILFNHGEILYVKIPIIILVSFSALEFKIFLKPERLKF